MPSGSKKVDYKPEQYERQLAHARAWKQANADRVKRYNQDYNRNRRHGSDSDSRDAASGPSDTAQRLLDQP